MKPTQIEMTGFDKKFQESTAFVKGLTVRFFFYVYESWLAFLGVKDCPLAKFSYKACVEQLRHHCASDMYKADWHRVNDADSKATKEQKLAAQKRMDDGYTFDFTLAPTKSGQAGTTRKGSVWGEWSKFVPVALLAVDTDKFKPDTDEWKQEVLAICAELKKQADSLKASRKG